MKAKLYPHLLSLIVFIISISHAGAQQYQFTSSGAAGAGTVSNTQIINVASKVTNVNGNQIGYSGPYAPVRGDRVLIIQMMGVDSGSWQWDTVSAGGNPCTVSNLYRSFDITGGGKVQIIKVPQYRSLHITNTGNLTAAPWNDSTGGILTFMVRDTFSIDSGGRCDVSKLGFRSVADTTPTGTHGWGGPGGAGGAIGQNGGDSALVVGSGVGGGGDGGMFGQYGRYGDTAWVPICPGCANFIDSADNHSMQYNGIAVSRLLMGGAGIEGQGGRGGRGGGGGGGGTAGPGTYGGAGGRGGRGGDGGNGAGIILYSAGYLHIHDSTLVFYAAGENADNGATGNVGGAGGTGGDGIGPCTSGPGGGGRGASGGNGGNGGGGGGGGIVYGVLFHAEPPHMWLALTTVGGIRGQGGPGGPGGPGGQNGVVLTGGSCSGAAGVPPGPDGDPGNDGNNGNNGTGASSSGGGGGGGCCGTIEVHPCALVNIHNSNSNIIVGYGCSTNDKIGDFEAGITGGTGAYYFYGIDTQSGPTYTNYNFQVIDGQGCGADLSASVQQLTPSDYAASYIVTPACQATANGDISIAFGAYASAASACDSIMFSNTIYDQYGNALGSDHAWGLLSGTYTVEWTAFGYPVTTDTIQVPEDLLLTITPTITDPTCYNTSGGEIDIQVSGEDPCLTYNYYWDNGGYGYINFGLTSGNYTVSVYHDGYSNCPPQSQSTIFYQTNYGCIQTEAFTIANPSTSATVNMDAYVCQGQLYFFEGNFYNTGTTTIPPANPGGCDTTIILTVAEYTTPSGDEFETICDGTFFYWDADGNYYSQGGNYAATIYGGSATGCDSIANLYLTVLPPITQTISTPAVLGNSCGYPDPITALGVTGGDGFYSWNSINYLPSSCIGNTLITPYTVDITDSHNCYAQLSGTYYEIDDSFSISVTGVSPTICGNDGALHTDINDQTLLSCNPYWELTIYDSNGQIFTDDLGQSSGPYDVMNLAAGNYTYTLTSGSSFVSCTFVTGSGAFTISGVSAAVGSEYDTICDAASFLWNGSTYTQAGSYPYTILGGSAGGCDSIATLYLTVLPAIPPTDLFDTISAGQSVVVGSTQYSTGGTYHLAITSASGCDSVVNLYLVVLQNTNVTYVTNNDTLCAGQSITVGIHQYSATGSYIDTLSGSGGAMSIITSNVYVYPLIATTNIAASVCSGQSYVFGNTSYNQSGNYSYTFTSASGCDSVVLLALTVYNAGGSTLSQTICAGQSYIFAGNVYAAAGTYTASYNVPSGCDSVVTLTLNVLPPVTGTQTVYICPGQSYSFAGTTYAASGTYDGTFVAASGCDSIVTLSLTVTPQIPKTVYDTICQGEAHIVGTHIYSATGIYTDQFPSVIGGCDTIQTLYLTVLPDVTPTLVITVSTGPTINGQQTDTFRASYTGCDGAYYSWYLNLQPVGQHDSLAIITHLIAQGDSIICRIDCDNRCASTTYTYSNRILSGLTDQDPFISSINVYPNPNSGNFTVEIKSIADKDAVIGVVDVLGQSIMSGHMALRSGDNKQLITLNENTAAGIYILEVTVEGHTLYQPLTVGK